MNRPYGGRDKENFDRQNRRQRLRMGEFDRPGPSRYGHVGQSLVDYQVKPPPLSRGTGPGPRGRPDFDPMYDDPYY